MNANGSQNELTKQNVKIIPSLVIGAGGTGVDTVRYVKERVRSDWSSATTEELPDLIQFYAIDTVSYANRPNQEFLSPSEYGFMGGFDPHELSQRHRAIREWWTFSPQLIPPGVVHLGARQIRPLGRMAFFSAFPQVWPAITRKLDRLNSVSASTQATRYGYKLPVETSGRQVFLVGSICGGTGSGCLLDLAARIRAHERTNVKIVAVLVLPSVFDAMLPGERQRQRVRANAYAALKEIDALWHGGIQFEPRYSGESEAIQLQYALFDEIYLIGYGRRGRSLSSLDDIKQQIAHFIYLTTFNNLADPVDERKVNFDRTRKFYSSFAVGALALPEARLSKGMLARLKRDYLLNLARDKRHELREEELRSKTVEYLDGVIDLARKEAQRAISQTASDFNVQAGPLRPKIMLDLIRWLVGTVIPDYGLAAVLSVQRACADEYTDLQNMLVERKDALKIAQRDLEWIEWVRRFFGDSLTSRVLMRGKQNTQYYQEQIRDLDAEIATLRMLVPDPHDATSGERLLSFVKLVLDQLSRAISRFMEDTERLVGRLNREQQAVLNHAGNGVIGRDNGHAGHYYEMELDPTTLGNGMTFTALWDSVVTYEKLRDTVAAEHILKAERPSSLLGSVKPPRALELLGLPAAADVAEFLDEADNLNLVVLDQQKRNQLIETLVADTVDEQMRRLASLNNFLRPPLDQLVKQIMNSVQPFWSAWPFPDEHQMEKIHMLCLADDPAMHPTTKKIFAEYQPPYQFVPGSNPYRLDALCIEHAVELKYISEVVACKAAYKAFRDRNEHESLHLQPNFSSLADPT